MRVRTLLASFAIVVALASPAALSALTAEEIQTQINALLTQIRDLRAQLSSQHDGDVPAASAVRHRICGMLAQTLHEGDENEGVRALQEFLASEQWLAVAPTGFFGTLTRDALRRWQAHHQIVSSGDAETTGWGVFGPRSRAFLMRWCQGVVGVENAVPTLTNQTSTSTSAGNQPPAINSFDGPSTLAVNANGTWTVNATDPEGQPLRYHVAWGDQTSVFETLLALADLAGFTSATTFTHSYSSTGLYQVTIRVSDGGGGISSATTFVRVQLPQSTTESSFGFSSGSILDGFGGVSSRLLDPQQRLPYNSPTRSGILSSRSICPAETFQCPDGIVVERSGPSCHFLCSSDGYKINSPVRGITSYVETECQPTASDPYCLEGTVPACVHDGQQYAQNQTRVETSCFDAEGGNPNGCVSKTFVCRAGAWQQWKPKFDVCRSGGQTFAHGASHPAVTSEGFATEIGSAICYDGSWTPLVSSGKTCKYNRVTYAHGEKAPCLGDIGNPDMNYSGCYPSQSPWVLENVCRNGIWYQEAVGPGGSSVPAGASCTTPWSGQVISSGGTIGKEPYFTGGAYTGSPLIPLMRCSNGSWLQCDHQGNFCQTF